MRKAREFNAPAVADSRQLQKLLALLENAGKAGVTTLEINQGTSIMAPSTAVSKLRNAPNHIPVQCVYERTTDEGSRVYRFTLEKFLENQGENLF